MQLLKFASNILPTAYLTNQLHELLDVRSYHTLREDIAMTVESIHQRLVLRRQGRQSLASAVSHAVVSAHAARCCGLLAAGLLRVEMMRMKTPISRDKSHSLRVTTCKLIV
jgi:hypothetical protein